MGKKYNIERVLSRYRKCVYCESREKLCVDCVVPVSKIEVYGLSLEEVHNYSNLVAACGVCNQKKANKSLEEFFEQYPRYKENFLRNSKYVSDKVLSVVKLIRYYYVGIQT